MIPVVGNQFLRSLSFVVFLIIISTTAIGQDVADMSPIGKSPSWLTDRLKPISSCHVVEHLVEAGPGDLRDDLWQPVERTIVFGEWVQTPIRKLLCDLGERVLVAFFIVDEESIFRLEEFSSAEECRRRSGLNCAIEPKEWRRYEVDRKNVAFDPVVYVPATNEMEGMRDLISAAMNTMDFETARRLAFDSSCQGSPPAGRGPARASPKLTGDKLVCLFSGSADGAGVWRSSAVWLLPNDFYFFAHRSIVDIAAERRAIAKLHGFLLDAREAEADRNRRRDRARQQVDSFFD